MRKIMNFQGFYGSFGKCQYCGYESEDLLVYPEGENICPRCGGII